jgi:hypothetical protein
VNEFGTELNGETGKSMICQDTPTDAAPGFQHDDLFSRVNKLTGSGQSGCTSADYNR